MPLPNAISFSNSETGCIKTVYYANERIFTYGVEDSFNIGEAEDMDHLLDRYIDFTEKPFINRYYKTQKRWNSESFLLGVMESRYNICVRSNEDIRMQKLRKLGHTYVYSTGVKSDPSWIQINPQA
jgi:hypothetical protein